MTNFCKFVLCVLQWPVNCEMSKAYVSFPQTKVVSLCISNLGNSKGHDERKEIKEKAGICLQGTYSLIEPTNTHT